MGKQSAFILQEHWGAAGKLMDQLRRIWTELASSLKLSLVASFLLTAAWLNDCHLII